MLLAYLVLIISLHSPMAIAQHDGAPGKTMPSVQSEKLPPAVALERFIGLGKSIDSELIKNLPVQSQGRIKPLDTFARETVLYLTGKYSFFGLNAIQLYFAIIISNNTSDLALINIRDPNLREKLGFMKSERYYSLAQLEQTELESLLKPVIDKQRQNEKSITPDEKKILEAAQQSYVLRSIQSGEHFFQAL